MEVYYYQSALLYGALCCLYIFFIMEKRKNKFLQLLFKILPLFIILYTVAKIRMSQTAPFHIKSPFFGPKLSKSAYGIIFSMIGDAYILFPNLFLYGVISFAITHIFFFLMFVEDLEYTQIRSRELTVLFTIGLVSLVLYIFLQRKMKCCMKFCVFLYTFIITITLWSALVQLLLNYSPITIAGAIGVTLFYISDVLLSMNKWIKPIPMADTLIMTTYYTAQFLIGYSIALSE